MAGYDICILTSVHPRYDPRIYHRQARTLASRYRVLLAAHDRSDGTDAAGIDHIRAAVPLRRPARIASGWIKYFFVAMKSGARICIIHDPELIPAGLLLRRFGRRVVLDLHEQLGAQVLTKDWIPGVVRPAASALADRFIRAAAKRFDAVLCASPAIKRDVGAGAAVIRNYPLAEEYPEETPRGKTGDACYIGTISVRRGMKTMARAARLAGVTLHIAGDIEDECSREIIRRGRRDGYIRYYGRLGRAELSRLLSRCSSGLCLLRAEGGYPLAIPIKLFEYLAAGLRVVASDFPYWRRLTSGLTGIDFAEPDDAVRAARLIRKNALAPDRPKEEERRRILERFCWEKEGQKLLEAMEKL